VTQLAAPDQASVAGGLDPVGAPALGGRSSARSRAPAGLVAISAAVAVVLILPLVFLLIEAQGAGLSKVWHLMDRPLTRQLLWNTVHLAVVVTVLCAIIGTGAAWLIERTNLPGRRVWAVLVVVPLAIPDFVVAFGWAQISTWVAGFRGAVLVMTLAVYPLVYLPVASSLRNADPSQEEVARSLGAGRLRTFFRITIGQARNAILGGCLLVVLLLLAEYGAFEQVGYQTFTTEIFSEFHVDFSINAACALSLVLVALGLVVLAAEGVSGGRGRVSRSDRMAQRPAGRHRLGWWTVPGLLAMAALIGLALGVPVGSSIYLWITGPKHVIQGDSMVHAAGYTFAYSAVAAAIATVAALPVAILAVRHDGRMRRLLERSTYIVLAVPGLVIALSLSYFSSRYANDLWYQTTPMLVLAYAIMFFPLALVGVRASVAQAPPGLEEVARSLGQGQLAVLWRVTRPLIAPGLAAAFCLVFLSAVTELTATLILVPTGVETLATQFWQYQGQGAYGQAAPFALLMIAVAAVPSYVLGRYFDRLPGRATNS
jgi:iron(III) transport system permease protein